MPNVSLLPAPAGWELWTTFADQEGNTGVNRGRPIVAFEIAHDGDLAISHVVLADGSRRLLDPPCSDDGVDWLRSPTGKVVSVVGDSLDAVTLPDTTSDGDLIAATRSLLEDVNKMRERARRGNRISG